MQKRLIALTCLALVSIATTASAASYSYSSVQTSVSGGSSASASINTVMTGGGANSEVRINGELVPSAQSTIVDKQLPPIPPRATNREIVNRSRDNTQNPPVQNMVRIENTVKNVNGTTTGQVHIYRKENGQVIEDRTVPIPPNSSGKPYIFRSSTTPGASGGVVVAEMIASGSRAIMVRDIASTSRMPWLMHVPFFSLHGMGVSSTPDENKVPFVRLLDRVFSMFTR